LEGKYDKQARSDQRAAAAIVPGMQKADAIDGAVPLPDDRKHDSGHRPMPVLRGAATFGIYLHSAAGAAGSGRTAPKGESLDAAMKKLFPASFILYWLSVFGCQLAWHEPCNQVLNLTFLLWVACFTFSHHWNQILGVEKKNETKKEEPRIQNIINDPTPANHNPQT
jgi:hypothetical protein